MSSPSNRSPARDLSFVTSLGGHTRRHRYLGHLRSFLWLGLASIAIQTTFYLAFVFPFRGMSAGLALFTLVVLSLPVVGSSLILAAFRRHDSPIITALVVYGTLFCVMVSAVSAARFSISYVALAFCWAIGASFICAANASFHLLRGDKIRILPFQGAADVALAFPGSRVLSTEEIECFPTSVDFDVLLTDDTSYQTAEWAEFLSRMHILGIDIVSADLMLEKLRGRVNIKKFELYHVIYSPSEMLYSRMKRFFDLTFVVLTSPVWLVVAGFAAAYIFCRDPGPVIFVQIRRGFGNRRFRMYKLRTMFEGTAGGATVVGDKRVIPGCGFLRKLRIDEIPQFFNILRGDMSLVGPRPVAEYVAKASVKVEPKYAYRCVVLPGITGWAQVNAGYASNVDEEIVKLSFDLYYIKRFSVDLDLVILLKTVKTVLLGLRAR